MVKGFKGLENRGVIARQNAEKSWRSGPRRALADAGPLVTSEAVARREWKSSGKVLVTHNIADKGKLII